jgi:hypothetical protein
VLDQSFLCAQPLDVDPEPLGGVILGGTLGSDIVAGQVDPDRVLKSGNVEVDAEHLGWQVMKYEFCVGRRGRVQLFDFGEEPRFHLGSLPPRAKVMQRSSDKQTYEECRGCAPERHERNASEHLSEDHRHPRRRQV